MRIVALLLLLAACRKQEIAHDAPAARPNVVDVEAGPSLYALSMNLVDQDGKAIGLDVWRGHPVLVGMFYATCPSACPLFVSTIKGVESSLDRGGSSKGGEQPPLDRSTRAELRVLLVSFDPNDTPEVLSKLADKHHVDRERWRFASGSEDQVRDLAAALGVKYRRLPDGSYNHTSPLVLLGRDGSMLVRVESVGDPTDGLAERLRGL